MTRLNTVIRTLALIPASALLLSAGCLGQESGIDERHIMGVAIIPPMEYTEVETGDESANDEIDTAEFVDYVAYAYTTVRGALSSAGYVLNQGYNGDFDIYQFTSGIEGDVVFDLEWEGAGNMDLFLWDAQGTEVQASEGASGFESLSVTVAEEDELFLVVVGKSIEEGTGGVYTLVMKALDPIDAGDMMVGAYLNGDMDDMGNPVSGTSINEWTADHEFYRYWATFDMHIVQEVQTIADVFVSPEMEDGKDNNCDGVSDRGDSLEDADGDGAKISDGDCDDTNAAIRPGFPDDLGDGIDGDCDGWADNGLDGTDMDGDGMSVFAGDCNDADPTIFKTLSLEDEMGDELGLDLLPDGKDNNCDGSIDNGATGDDDDSAGADEWPADADADGYTIEDGDCNDADPTIHPCDEDDDCLDYRDGKDNDCDGDPGALGKDLFDENFEWICETGDCDPLYRSWDEDTLEWTYVGTMIEDPGMNTDDDGDGFAENWGDCNDTDPNVYPGNYELETRFAVDSDIDTVWLYAGTFSTLNSTSVASGDIVMSEPQELDLSTMADSMVWSMNQDWEGEGGTLVPEGMPELLIDTVLPPLFGLRCEDEEPNDCEYGAISTWTDCYQDCGGLISADGLVDKITGTFETIVQDTWDGDNDTYYITIPQDGNVHAVLDWETDSGDMDMMFYCYYGDDFNPWNWYYFMTETADLTKPEEDITYFPLPAGTECFAWVVGYAGPNGEPYSLKLWMEPEEI